MTDSAASTPKSYHTDPTLYLYTSLTAGSSHIITATSRLETILKANKIPFKALDVATDEKARMLWGRRAGKKKLPGLVRMGLIIGDLEEVEEWNEYGELKDNIQASAPKSASTPTPSATNTPSKPPSAPSAGTPLKTSTTSTDSSKPTTAATETPTKGLPSTSTASTENPLTTAMRQASLEAAKKAGDAKTKARTDALDAMKAKDEGLQKLDNSAPTGMPPPTGTTEASDAVKGVSGEAKVQGKSDEVPETGGHGEEEVLEGVGLAENESVGEGVPSAKEVETMANRSILEDKSHAGATGDGGLDSKPAVSANDDGENLLGKRTQEQDAADGTEAGTSVAD